MPFFSDFLRKNYCSNAHVVSKRRSFSKKTLLSCSYFVKKTSTLSKTLYSHVIFVQLLHKEPPAVMPIFDQKNVNSVKTTLYYGSKKSIGYPFFRFVKEITSLMPLFWQENVHSRKNTLLVSPYFIKKRLVFQNTVLSSNFSNFSWKTPPIFGQKNVNSFKTTIYYGPNKSIRCPFLPIFHKK